MIRIVAFLLALLLAPLTARGNTFDTYVLSYAPTDYWSLSTNANDTGSGGNNGSCSGTCNYSTTGVGPYVGGMNPGASASYVGVTQAFTAAAGWQFGEWFNTTGTGLQVLFAAYNYTNSTFYIDVNDSDCGTGNIAFIFNGASSTNICGYTVNDGNPHFALIQCASGSCQAWVDGYMLGAFAYSVMTYPSQLYQMGNLTGVGPLPTVGYVGAVMFWNSDVAPLTSWQIGQIYQCGLANFCGPSTPPPPACFARPGMTQEWCDTMQYTGCSASGAPAWWRGPLGPATTATGASFSGIVQPTTAIGTIAGFTLTIDSISAGAFAPGDPVTGTDVTSGTTIVAQLTGGGTGQTGTYSLSASSTVAVPETIGTTNYKINPSGATLALGSTVYDTNGCGVSGNTNISNQTQIMSGLIATNWYVVTPGSTVAAESMWPGQWQAGTYLHNNITLGGNTSIVVAQNGGGGGSGGYTARYLPTPMAPGTELTAIAFMWFTAPQGSPNEWTDSAFGFASSGGGQHSPAIAYVQFGYNNAPPSLPQPQVNFQVQLTATGIVGNFNCLANSWQMVVLDVKRSTGSDGFLSFQACGQAITYSGVTDIGGLGPIDQFVFGGQEVGGAPDAEAYLGSIGIYTGHYTPPYYPPGGGSGGPMTLWIP